MRRRGSRVINKTQTENKIGFSLRQLNPQKNSPLILRRLSDNATEEIGFNNGFLNISQSESFLNGSEGTVYRWNEQFNNNHLIGQSLALEPKLFDLNGIINYEGTPALRLLNSGMESISTVNWTPYLSFYAVIKTATNFNGHFVHSQISNINGQYLRGRHNTTFYRTDGGFTTVNNNINPSGMIICRTLRKEENIISLLVNGTTVNSGVLVGFSVGPSVLTMGNLNGGVFGDGYMSEFQFKLNSGIEDLNITNDLKTHYQINF